jgi:hypothetical protein
MKKELKTKLANFDWRPVTTTDMLLATTGALLTTTDDHWRRVTKVQVKTERGDCQL